jgi:hypothetical protein
MSPKFQVHFRRKKNVVPGAWRSESQINQDHKDKVQKNQLERKERLNNELIKYLRSKQWINENYISCEKCSYPVHRDDCLFYCWECSITVAPLANTKVASNAIDSLKKLSFPCHDPNYDPDVPIDNMQNLTSATTEAVLMPPGSKLLVKRFNIPRKAPTSWSQILPFKYNGDEYAPISIRCGTAMQIYRSVLNYYYQRRQNLNPCHDIGNVKVEGIVYVEDNIYGCHMTYSDGN